MSFDLPILERPVLDLRFFRRSFRDQSGYGHHMNPTGAHWLRAGSRDALRFTGTGRGLILNTSNLALTIGAIIVCGDFNRYDMDDRLLSKAGAYELRLSSDTLITFASATTSTAFVNYKGSKTIIVVFNDKEIPTFGVDGSFVANGSVVADVQQNSNDIYIGNRVGLNRPSINAVGAILLFPAQIN